MHCCFDVYGIFEGPKVACREREGKDVDVENVMRRDDKGGEYSFGEYGSSVLWWSLVKWIYGSSVIALWRDLALMTFRDEKRVTSCDDSHFQKSKLIHFDAVQVNVNCAMLPLIFERIGYYTIMGDKRVSLLHTSRRTIFSATNRFRMNDSFSSMTRPFDHRFYSLTSYR